MDWPEVKDFGASPEEEVTRAEEAPLYITSCQKIRNSMPCSRMGPVALWGSSGGGRLLYGAPHVKLRKLRKEESPAGLQR